MSIEATTTDQLRRDAIAVLAYLGSQIRRSVDRLDYTCTADPDGSHRAWRWPDGDGAWWRLDADIGGRLTVAGPRWIVDMRVWNLDGARWVVDKLRELSAFQPEGDEGVAP